MTLILRLPSAHATEMEYVLSTQPGRITQSARLSRHELALLPSSQDVVGVLPWSELSWSILTLPAASRPWFEGRFWFQSSHGKPHSKAQALVQSALEDHLLGPFEDIHWVAKALPQQPNHESTGKSSSNTLTLVVAYCSRSWLESSLAHLDNTKLRITRLVPEFECSLEGSQNHLHAVMAPEGMELILCTPQGVMGFPSSAMPGFTALQEDNLAVYAEPPVIDNMITWIGRATLQTSSERLLLAAQSSWNMAQGEWAQHGLQRLQQRLRVAANAFWHAPQWQLTKWSLMAALVLQVCALNLWSWHLQSIHSQLQQQEREVVQDTFPQVKWVVDAPLQMKQALMALQTQLGKPSPGDFEHLLIVMDALHASLTWAKLSDIQEINYTPQNLSWRYNPTIVPQQSTLQLSVDQTHQGYRLQEQNQMFSLTWSTSP